MVRGRVDRYEAANVRALNFVMQGALGGGGPRTLRADNLGKTLGGALVRLEIDVPDATGRPPARAPRRRVGRRDPRRSLGARHRRGIEVDAESVLRRRC